MIKVKNAGIASVILSKSIAFTALVTATSPVRPTSYMPAEVSNVVPTTLVPKHPATIVPKESTRKDLFISFASLFSSVNPAFIESPVTVPILLKIDMKMKTNTHTTMSDVKI